MEDIEYAPGRGLDRGLIRELTTCRWVEEHLDLLVTGATGVGKTKGLRAISFRATRLFQAATLARAEGTYPRFLAKLSRVHVLPVEDFALVPMVERDRYDLLEILEDRYGARSTIVSSQLPPDAWHERLGDPTVADAVLDRLVHNAYRIALTGPSRRKGASRDRKRQSSLRSLLPRATAVESPWTADAAPPPAGSVRAQGSSAATCPRSHHLPCEEWESRLRRMKAKTVDRR